MQSIRFCLAWAFAWNAALAEPPKVAETKAGERYEFRKEHNRDGTGKFYMGREIALVMGHQAADWLERPTRDQEENPALLIKALKLKEGDVVADIGAGSGYYSFRLAERVGKTGKVFAVDIQNEMLDVIREKMKRTGRTNIAPILGAVDDPKLPADSVDLMLLVDVYHEFSEPYEMATAMVRALKPGGRLVFVEFRLEDPSVLIKEVHKMSVRQVLKEMAALPLVWQSTLDALPMQHVIIFEKPKEKKPAAAPARKP